VTEDVSDRIVRLPFYTSMTEEEQGRVVEEVKKLKP
jgi:dTDP-4-amino-4,6-dideoxygalactose transaminase